MVATVIAMLFDYLCSKFVLFFSDGFFYFTLLTVAFISYFVIQNIVNKYNCDIDILNKKLSEKDCEIEFLHMQIAEKEAQIAEMETQIKDDEVLLEKTIDILYSITSKYNKDEDIDEED